ncbi:MAG: cysteine desulfurase family protein, partial [Verrucomicrobiales bacterium]
MIYFDHNASAPMTASAKNAWLEAAEMFPGNPSSQHRLGQRASRALENASEELSAILRCDPMEIIWTSGATEANNLALWQFLEAVPPTKWVWVSPFEHPSIKEPLRKWFAGRIVELPSTELGQIDKQWVHNLLETNPPALIVTMAANNETGAIQEWEFLTQVAREYQAHFICDATQYLGRIPASKLGQCAFVSGSGHKFGGPRGVGFLKIPMQHSFRQMLFGGGQQESRRAGTENLPAILSMVAALKEADEQVQAPAEQRELWKREFEERIVANLPGTIIVSGNTPRLWNTSAMIMPEVDCRHRWGVRLDR